VIELFALVLLAQNSQNPSPMVENTRPHTRLQKRDVRGLKVALSLGELYIPEGKKPTTLLMHFHGGTWIPQQVGADNKIAVLAIQIGAGSSVYARPFRESGSFAQLLDEASRAAHTEYRTVLLSGWSAGYGAIREILRVPANVEKVHGVILIDGLHVSYDPEGKPGPLQPDGLQPFLAFAKDAIAGKKRMLIVHSEIFPGTYASTTETADWLIKELGLKRRPVLKKGPLGSQQLSDVKAGKLEILGFAGNSAPDHVDLLHALGSWLKMII
jgi:hypothetical protein